jgi:general secretion pathway protein G
MVLFCAIFLVGEVVNMRKPNGNSTSAMTLLELLVAITIMVILIGAAGLQIKGLIQRAKVSAAKTTILSFGLCLSMVKEDTGLYPLYLEHLNKAEPPTDDFSSPSWCGSSRNWCGPYGEALSLIDPWGNPYQYELSETAVFGPSTFERTTGQPYEETFTFTASPDEGTLIIDNPGITAGSIILNGEEIVSEDEFKRIIPVIIKKVNLLASNTITIWLASKPGITITISVTAQFTSKDATFALWSYGRDGKESGEKYDKDIVYGHF